MAMELRTHVVNTCKRKGRRRVANRGKVATDLPIRRFLAGDWRTRERTTHRMEHQRDEFHATLEEQLINVWNNSWSITSINT